MCLFGWLKKKKPELEEKETRAEICVNADKSAVLALARKELQPMSEQFIIGREIFENNEEEMHCKVITGLSSSGEIKGEAETWFAFTSLENGGTKVTLRIKGRGIIHDAKLVLQQFSIEFGEIKEED